MNNATEETKPGSRNVDNQYVSVNSIQTSAYVERMPIIGGYTPNKIWKYDIDNLYPQKALSICDRSWSIKTAAKTLSDFISGNGFTDTKLHEFIFNSTGETGYDILRQISDIKSKLGFALHFNFTIEGLISSITVLDFELLRFRKDGKIVWKSDWQKWNADEVIYSQFNIDNVKSEIAEVGLENYTGQVLYWKGTNKIYPLATFDAVLDDGQYQAESKLFSLRNIQNDFSGSGAVIYPKSIEGTSEFKAFKSTMQGLKGANNAGNVLLVGLTPDFMEMSKGKMYHPFERNNVDSLFTNQNKESRESIFSIFRQPAILNAITESGMFNQQSLQDAFVFYNSITQQDRLEVENTFKKVIDNSIWAGQFNDFSIQPKVLIDATGNPDKEETETKTEE